MYLVVDADVSCWGNNGIVLSMTLTSFGALDGHKYLSEC